MNRKLVNLHYRLNRLRTLSISSSSTRQGRRMRKLYQTQTRNRVLSRESSVARSRDDLADLLDNE